MAKNSKVHRDKSTGQFVTSRDDKRSNTTRTETIRHDRSGRIIDRDSTTGDFKSSKTSAYPGDPIPAPLKTKPKKKD